MRYITKVRISYIACAIGIMGLLPFSWKIAGALAPDRGIHPMSWPFILLPFVGVFIAIDKWPVADPLENKRVKKKQ